MLLLDLIVIIDSGIGRNNLLTRIRIFFLSPTHSKKVQQKKFFFDKFAVSKKSSFFYKFTFKGSLNRTMSHPDSDGYGSARLYNVRAGRAFLDSLSRVLAFLAF